jgi:hypothetical protein
MPGQPASPPPEPSPEPSGEPPGERLRLDDFLEYRARALLRRRARQRLRNGALACVAGGLAIILIVSGGGRILRHGMAPKPIPIESPGIALPGSSVPRAASATTADTDHAAEPAAETPSPAVPTLPAAVERRGQAKPEPPAPRAATARVSDERPERLAVLRPGDMKERVFDLFGTTFERQQGAVVRVEGMRLRARGRSPRYEQVEVADVRLADSLYWFLFGDGRLLAWGRPGDWRAVAQRHQLEVDYPP